MAIAKAAKLALSGTRADLDANLAENDAAIGEPLAREHISDTPQRV